MDKVLKLVNFKLFFYKKINKCFLLKTFLFIYSFFLTHPIYSQEIRFPEEELARESVFPVFENNKHVTMNRNVTIKYRLDVHGSALFRGDEPFYFRLLFFPGMSFYFTETQGIGLSGIYFMPGRSSIGERLLAVRSQEEGVDSVKYDATLSPHPMSAFFVNYVLTPFYGKMSFSKSIVSNFNISILVGAGAVQLVQNQCSLCQNVELNMNPNDSLWRPALWIGLKQKMFFNRYFYIYGKFGFLSYYGPNPVNPVVLNAGKTPPLKNFVDPNLFYFDSKAKEVFMFRNVIGGGIGFLLF